MKYIGKNFQVARAQGDTPHEVFDAGLKNGALLHRFANNADVLYSAIYIGNEERWTCERSHEQGMLRDWNLRR